ncbi:hypothetical protein C8R46DRAFT_906326 [Mycena filopes]|nr:hypothetical protein C8R46DRAFT_906326 [Mycena filopes]
MYHLPAGCKWNRLFLSKGALLVPDIRARVRMRIWAIERKSVDAVEFLLTLALLQGVPFTLAVPRDVAHEFAPENVSDEDRALGWTYYDVGSIEEPLTWNKGGAAWAIAWVKKILDILKRPHMRALVSLGGPLAWIARRYRPNLLKEFMEGPSTQVAVHFKGWNDSRYSNSWGLMADSVSESEKDILRGVVTVEGVSKALYPTEDLCLEFFEHYSGENNEGFDKALAHIWREIDEGRPHPRSNQEMKGHLRRFHNGINKPQRARPAKDNFVIAEERFKTVFDDDWTKIYARDVVLPGSVKNDLPRN